MTGNGDSYPLNSFATGERCDRNHAIIESVLTDTVAREDGITKGDGSIYIGRWCGCGLLKRWPMVFKTIEEAEEQLGAHREHAYVQKGRISI